MYLYGKSVFYLNENLIIFNVPVYMFFYYTHHIDSYHIANFCHHTFCVHTKKNCVSNFWLSFVYLYLPSSCHTPIPSYLCLKFLEEWNNGKWLENCLNPVVKGKNIKSNNQTLIQIFSLFFCLLFLFTS